MCICRTSQTGIDSVMLRLSHLVLESVPSAFQVHVFGVGVVETALTQFTVESNHLSVIVTDLKQFKYVHIMQMMFYCHKKETRHIDF